MEMEITQRFDAQKAIEVLLWVSKRCTDMYRVLKVLYFADKDHLAKYGRLICDDRYIAMKHGLVPSGAYDIVKMARGDSPFSADQSVTTALRVDGCNIVPLRDPNLDLLSPSDIECLEESVAKYGRMSFSDLKALSHTESVFRAAANENDAIPMIALVKSVPDGDLLWEFLTTE